jgi:DNA-binding MarR family transcriptional regulator
MNQNTSRPKRVSRSEAVRNTDSQLFNSSVGYQVRQTNRLIQKYLQQKIEPHGVTLGMWYFLRSLWITDGLTQKELSTIVGTMEPTTLTAIKAMERNGLVRRVPNKNDRRKINIYLTDHGQNLAKKLIPLGREVTRAVVANLTAQEVERLLSLLGEVQTSLIAEMGGGLDDPTSDQSE